MKGTNNIRETLVFLYSLSDQRYMHVLGVTLWRGPVSCLICSGDPWTLIGAHWVVGYWGPKQHLDVSPNSKTAGSTFQSLLTGTGHEYDVDDPGLRQGGLLWSVGVSLDTRGRQWKLFLCSVCTQSCWISEQTCDQCQSACVKFRAQTFWLDKLNVEQARVKLKIKLPDWKWKTAVTNVLKCLQYQCWLTVLKYNVFEY